MNFEKKSKKSDFGESVFLQFATIHSPQLSLSASKLNFMSNSCKVNEPAADTIDFRLQRQSEITIKCIIDRFVLYMQSR